jgi:hypothetical protein
VEVHGTSPSNQTQYLLENWDRRQGRHIGSGNAPQGARPLKADIFQRDQISVLFRRVTDTKESDASLASAGIRLANFF